MCDRAASWSTGRGTCCLSVARKISGWPSDMWRRTGVRSWARWTSPTVIWQKKPLASIISTCPSERCRAFVCVVLSYRWQIDKLLLTPYVRVWRTSGRIKTSPCRERETDGGKCYNSPTHAHTHTHTHSVNQWPVEARLSEPGGGGVIMIYGSQCQSSTPFLPADNHVV